MNVIISKFSLNHPKQSSYHRFDVRKKLSALEKHSVQELLVFTYIITVALSIFIYLVQQYFFLLEVFNILELFLLMADVSTSSPYSEPGRKL